MAYSTCYKFRCRYHVLDIDIIFKVSMLYFQVSVYLWPCYPCWLLTTMMYCTIVIMAYTIYNNYRYRYFRRRYYILGIDILFPGIGISIAVISLVVTTYYKIIMTYTIYYNLRYPYHSLDLDIDILIHVSLFCFQVSVYLWP